ncbi:hypothetical protein AVEN_2194-1 [Araneus ventricosus]|uniref:Uncharacterized protein n=1 Tax=Araneus ventricosus TaxID=182803 RepID=A0A4Y2RGF7_ARAVE|nr:hypothetical protein AVEN_2194-1 [Araneus ventricosus]
MLLVFRAERVDLVALRICKAIQAFHIPKFILGHWQVVKDRCLPSLDEDSRALEDQLRLWSYGKILEAHKEENDANYTKMEDMLYVNSENHVN